MPDADLTSQDVAKLSAPTDLMGREWAPCRWNCPVHADVRTYIEKAAAGEFQSAIDVIRENLPFACVCGRICHHPCEANCRRTDVDAPIAIREVKRFVGELAGAKATVRKAAQQDKEARVAIVGAGPAGLSAALLLAQRGYHPTVFEKFPIAGGIPATAIPKYRLPREVLQMDVDWICSHGVELVTGVEIGKDKTLADLKKEGFAAVLVAAGLAKSRTLPLPGADHKRVLPVLNFLEDLAFDRTPDIGKNVIVVGGGNVAVDAARSALRMGAAVRMMMLENEKEMPAFVWEQDEAKEEGIAFVHRRGPVEVVVQGGHIVGLKARKVTRVFEAPKKFNPAYDDSDVITLECDTVIMAIGQMADTGFVKGSDLKLDERGRLTYNKFTQQTNLPTVFACGEIVTPPGSAVEACASGKRAAAAIDLFLSGKDIAIDDKLPPFIDKITPKTAEKVIKVDRQKVPTEAPEARKHCWTETDHNFSPAAALAEARRCMNCGSGAEVLVDKCAACLTCARVCPFGIPKVTDVARIESTLCQACGICIAECPANAIVSRAGKPAELSARVSAALSGEGPRSIAFVCGHKASAEQWKADPDLPGLTEIYLPSIAGIRVMDLMGALEKGAHTVLVIACRSGQDRYPQANARIRNRVQQAKDLLREAGLDSERVKLVELTVT
jgi:NADPH-dependent glutamate synthase beta subunit-like oxidoreductase/coenzyme F420-reducing hydrogenase delta subunit